MTKKAKRTRFSKRRHGVVHKTIPILRSGLLDGKKRKTKRSIYSTRFKPLKHKFAKTTLGDFKFRSISQVWGGGYIRPLQGYRLSGWTKKGKRKSKKSWGSEEKATIGKTQHPSKPKRFGIGKERKKEKEKYTGKSTTTTKRPIRIKPLINKKTAIMAAKMKPVYRKGKQLDYYRNLESELKHQTIKFQKLRGVYLGPYPAPLGYEKVCSIRLTSFGKSQLRGVFRRRSVIKISKWFLKIKNEMVAAGKKFIAAKVPLRYGSLRKSLIRSLVSSEVCDPANYDVEKCILKMRFGSSLYYAGISNRMPDSWLRHVRDPKAVQYFFSKTTAHLKKTAKKLVSEMFSELRFIINTRYNVPVKRKSDIVVYRGKKMRDRGMYIPNKPKVRGRGRVEGMIKRAKGKTGIKPTFSFRDLIDLTLEEKDSAKDKQMRGYWGASTRKDIIGKPIAFQTMHKYFDVADLKGYSWSDHT